MVTIRKQSRQQRRCEIRQREKSFKRQGRAEAEVATQIKKLLRSVLLAEQLDEISKITRFITRKRELSSSAAVAVLMLGCSGSQDISSLETICLYLKKWFNISMKPQSLQGRLNRKESAAFVKEVMTRVMMHEANKMMEKILRKHTKGNKKHHLYKRILLQDSTIISLPESLARIFKGCGGSASKAAIKCDVIINQINHLIVRMRCVAGRIPDAALSDDIMEYLEEGDLVIRDLGYFNLDNFLAMIQKNVKFISRLRKNVWVYLTAEDETPVDLIKHLDKLGINNKNIDIEVYIGKNSRIPMRLIGIKVPPEIVEVRLERHKKIRKSDPSEKLQEWNGYTMILTNIQKNELNLKQILKMYRVRWQIEWPCCTIAQRITK